MNWLLSTEFGQIVLLISVLLIMRLLIKNYLAIFIKNAVKTHESDESLAQKKRADTLINIIGTTLYVIIWIIGFIGLLAILHVNIAGIITGAGVFGLIIGLGGQSMIKDFLAGFFILIENQYREGDIVTLNNTSGIVEKISLRITKLRDLDGDLHILPNGSIETVSNKTFGWSNVNLNIGVSYESDIDKVMKVINDCGQQMAEHGDWHDKIIKPIEFLRIDGFRDSSVEIKTLGKVVAGTQWEVAGEFRGRLKKAFEKNNIEIPFPQRVIHTKK